MFSHYGAYGFRCAIDHKHCRWVWHVYIHTYTCITAFCLGLHGSACTRKGEPVWIYWSKRQWVAVASAGPYAYICTSPQTNNHASIPPHSFYRPYIYICIASHKFPECLPMMPDCLILSSSPVAEMRIVRWMCGVNLQDRVPSEGLKERLVSDDIISELQQKRLRWYGHVLRKEDNDWVKKCLEYEVQVVRPRGRPKKTWREIVERD